MVAKKKYYLSVTMCFLFSLGHAQYESDLRLVLDAHSSTKVVKYTEVISKSTTNELSLIGIGTIRFYQLFISSQDMPVCNFTPSCSQFGALAIKKYGIVIGSLMTSDRLQRCNTLARDYYTIHPTTNKFNDPLEVNVLCEQ